MPKRSIEYFVLDILLFTHKIKDYAEPLKHSDDLLGDEIRQDAILRKLELIGEAMNHILKSKKIRNHIRPSWRKIVDFRNLVIHEYFGISVEEVFRIAKFHTPVLEKEMIHLIQQTQSSVNFAQAFQDTKNDLKSIGRKNSFAYLTKVERLLKLD